MFTRIQVIGLRLSRAVLILCTDREVAASYATICSVLFTDFIEQAKGLYRTLDTQNNDKVDRVICDTLSMQLHRAVDLDTSDVSR